MRTNIEIDDDLMAKALQAGPFKTKKDAVDAGLRLLARQAAYREILKWRGKLQWEGEDTVDWTRADAKAEAAAKTYAPAPPAAQHVVNQPKPASKTAGRARR